MLQQHSKQIEIKQPAQQILNEMPHKQLEQQPKLATNINVFNEKLYTNSSKTSNISAHIKRVNFDLPQIVEGVEGTKNKLGLPPPLHSVNKLSTKASSSSRNVSSSSNKGSRVENIVTSESTSAHQTPVASTSGTSFISALPLEAALQSNKTLTTYRQTSSTYIDASKPLNSLLHTQRGASNYTSLSSNKKSSLHHHYTHSPQKRIVYNGTYPIDLPLQSRFEVLARDYDPEANAESARLKYAHMLNDYDLDECDILDDVAEQDEDDEDFIYDDDDDEDYDEEDDVEDENGNIAEDVERLPNAMEEFITPHERPQLSFLSRLGILKESSIASKSPLVNSGSDENKHHAVWSMQELIANPSIPLNYQKMCHEVEQSLTSFEKYLDSKTLEQRKPTTQKQPVRTFDIDGPVEELDIKKKI
ncbi:uncharacterized protein [Eurosta solidaginis]|uniref:uncharacterized protein n=1 Tax=Eurosta solidaginis TaxID=178769 RepID=UPI0035310022